MIAILYLCNMLPFYLFNQQLYFYFNFQNYTEILIAAIYYLRLLFYKFQILFYEEHFKFLHGAFE